MQSLSYGSIFVFTQYHYAELQNHATVFLKTSLKDFTPIFREEIKLISGYSLGMQG